LCVKLFIYRDCLFFIHTAMLDEFVELQTHIRDIAGSDIRGPNNIFESQYSDVAYKLSNINLIFHTAQLSVPMAARSKV